MVFFLQGADVIILQTLQCYDPYPAQCYSPYNLHFNLLILSIRNNVYTFGTLFSRGLVDCEIFFFVESCIIIKL